MYSTKKMGKQPIKQSNKNQSVLKMEVGGKWEKIRMKKGAKVYDKLQPIQEVDEVEEAVQMTNNITTRYECLQGNKPTGTDIKDTEAIVEEVKLLVTKRKEITDEEDDQDVVIGTL